MLLIPAAAAEEIVFRGWLLRESAAVARNPVFLMVVNGVLFLPPCTTTSRPTPS